MAEDVKPVAPAPAQAEAPKVAPKATSKADDALKQRIAQATPETPGASGVDLGGKKRIVLPNGIIIENN